MSKPAKPAKPGANPDTQPSAPANILRPMFNRLDDNTRSQSLTGSLLDTGGTQDIDLRRAIQTDPKAFREHKDSICVRSFPSYLYLAIEQFQHSLTVEATDRRPGINVVLAACIYNGLKIIESHPGLSRLRDLREDMLSPNLQGPEHMLRIEELNQWFGSFSLKLKSGDPKMIRIYTPSYIKSELEDASHGLVATKTDIVILTVMLSLRTESEMFGAKIAESLQNLFKRVDERVGMSKSLMGYVGERKASNSKGK